MRVLLFFFIYSYHVIQYGQTGAGKTFTMMVCSLYCADLHNLLVPGPTCCLIVATTHNRSHFKQGCESHQGIIPRLSHDFFTKIEQIRLNDEKQHFTVKISFVEIYLERIRDLLGKGDLNLGPISTIAKALIPALTRTLDVTSSS